MPLCTNTVVPCTKIYPSHFGVLFKLRNQNDHIVFTSPHSSELYNLVTAFNSSSVIPVIDYVSTLSAIKARMFAAKGGAAWDR